MDRINCPFADEQLDFSIGSPAKNVEYFLFYYKILHPFSPSTAPALLFLGSRNRYRYRLPITVSRGGSTSFERFLGVITSEYQRGSVFLHLHMRASNRLQRSVQGLGPPGELAKYTLAHWVRLPVSFFSVPCSQ
jgi:hypothetical protein